MKYSKAVGMSVLACLTLMHSVYAQNWEPTKNVEIVVYAAPGGSNDKTARAIEKAVASKKLINSTMTVVNKTGGGGNIQLNYLTQHAGDPHVLMITTPTLLANHIVGSSEQNHNDFSPIASMINDYSVYVVNAESTIKTGKDLTDRLKANPDARDLLKLIDDGVIILTGTTDRQGLWAYEIDADKVGGIILVSGRARRATADDVKKYLEKK